MIRTGEVAYHRDDISCHVREAHAAGVKRTNQELSVLIRVFMFCHIVCLDHFLL